MEYNADNLDKAVTLFYRSEAQQQAEAHQWLTEAQNSPQAWSFVWELLNPQRSFQVQFFAATTLHTKLMKHWHEVPEDHYEPLKKRILEAIINYAMGPKIVLNRLCIALSAYIIHTIPTHWPNAFEELVSSFQPQHLPNVEAERVIWILLEILTVIPEEFQSTILPMGQRNRVRNILQEVSAYILKVVQMCLMPLPERGFDMMNLTTYFNAGRCASAWIQLGGINILESELINNLLIDLVCHVYWNKSDPEGLGGEEIEMIEVAVESLTAVIQHPHTLRYKSLVSKYAATILFKFEKILETERTSNDINKDIVATLYALIVTIADSHSRIFVEMLKSPHVEEQKISFDLFNSILKCTNLPGLYPVDETSSTLTFGFWYTLQDEILALDTAECAQLLLMIKPYYRDLVCVLLRKSMLPSASDDTIWSLDDKEVFRCYRQDVSDTFVYCYNVLNLEMLDILYTKLNEALLVKDILKWNEIETCLHGFSSVAESIEMENLFLPKLMVTIKNIPFSELPVKVMNTALETVGAYSEWLSDHPDMLENIYPLVISGLGNVEVATSATMALKDITHSCQQFMLPYVEHILMAAQVVFQNGTLKLGEYRRLMYSIGRVLSLLNVDRIMEYLNVILAPSFEEIQKLLNEEPSPKVAAPLVTRLKILSALFNSLSIETGEKNIEQPIFLVMRNTMYLYKLIAEKYSDDLEVITELSMLLKFGVTTLKDDCKPLVTDLYEIIVVLFRKNPQTHAILSVAKSIIILLGRDDEFKTINQQLITEISNITLHCCSQHSLVDTQLSEIADVLEGYFSMMANFMKKVPQLLFTTSCCIDMAALFQCAILCLVLPEIQTLKAVTTFLVQFIALSREMSKADVIQTYGESLVLRVLLNLGTTAPRSSVDVLSDILFQLNKKYCDNLSRWLNTLLAQENFPSPRITPQQKSAFIKIVLREKSNKRKLSESVLEFTLICRGILKQDINLP